MEQTVSSFRKALSNAQKHYSKFRTRTNYSLPDKLENLLHLSPEEFLLLTGSIRYGLPPETLSLILRIPLDTIEFRTELLRNNIHLTSAEIKDIHLQLQPLEKRRFSQLQKLKNKFRPQRFLWESLLIMCVIIVVLWMIPELRNRYEKWIQRKTSEYFVSGEMKDSPIPPELNLKPNIIEPETVSAVEEPDAADTVKVERKQPRASQGEVWRFSFTGSAKIDLEKELKNILQKHTEKPLRSSVAPGGIQYDAFVEVKDLVPLKVEFEGIADSQSHTLKMSWYKKKMATKKIPSGHVEVVIWISTI